MKIPPSLPPSACLPVLVTQSFENVACTVCGCVCDDLRLLVDRGSIVAAEHACSLSEPWLLAQTSADDFSTQADGKAVSFAEAVAAAADVLRRSRAPLIYGLSTSSTPGQRAACRLADLLGATIDTTASTCHAPSIIAVQSVGESTSSLGEVKNRADMVVYWGSNPLKSHPRHIERYVEASGMFVPGGRADRFLVVVDCQRTATSDIADQFLQVDPGTDFEVLWALRMILKGATPSEDIVGGVPLQQLIQLAQTMRTCRYGAMFFGLGLTKASVPHVNVEALLRLVTDLNSHTRWIARRMRIPGDVAGADSVLCWQTGFPFSVSFARGYPRYNPGEYTANNLLERGEVDSVMLVGCEGVEKLSSLARQRLSQIPTIVLANRSNVGDLASSVQFTTAIYGVHRAGTAYRMDEVPIPLRPVLESRLPSDEEVIDAIRRSICEKP
ncbi:MAG: formylmethanofuran dehydrogenase subunit B [Planctomycetales bacterium]|nr:formylmethanofuran dehydrogenase subunit B [Planctomycetales bacterium]